MSPRNPGVRQAPTPLDPVEPPSPVDPAAELREMVHQAAHLLPQQGPIGVFIHHNTLHAFQHLDFEEAVVRASALYGTEPYLEEPAYLDELATGRIRREDLEAVLGEILGERADLPIFPGAPTPRQLRLQILLFPPIEGTTQTARWHLVEQGLIDEHPGARALWKACHRIERQLKREQFRCDPGPRAIRPRDLLLALGAPDIDDLVHPILVRLCAAFVDQGVSYWPMPDRQLGFLGAVRSLLTSGPALLPVWMERLEGVLTDHVERDLTAESVVMETLDTLQVPADLRETLITLELLALPGWAGLLNRLERDPQAGGWSGTPPSLMDYLALRFVLMQLACEETSARCFDQPIRYPELRERHEKSLAESRPESIPHDFVLFQVFQRLGLDAGTLESMNPEDRVRLARKILSFDGLERRRVWHLAYERAHRDAILHALAAHRELGLDRPEERDLEAQVVFCIDERTESIRRHLEETAPRVETEGVAGFFGIPVLFRGLDHPDATPHCPIVLQPEHRVEEIPVHAESMKARGRHRWRRALGAWSHGTTVGTRSLVRGWIASTLLGIFSLLPLSARVLFPRQCEQFLRWLHGLFVPVVRTRLSLGRESAEASETMAGFTEDEMADLVGTTLREMGILHRLAPLVVLLGHGSSSRNNPHASAYDCGACGGRGGGPNARLFARMANHLGVRAILRDRGLPIRDGTYFVGGFHDTCDDSIVFFELEELPDSHREGFERLRSSLEHARAANALERCRRFESLETDASSASALRHVEQRSVDLAEARPEYGHSSNAACIIGRRILTRGLFLDRRTFPVSYDPLQDSDGEILCRVMKTVLPVVAGINLEYFFSRVDNEGYGCGSKLPHNLVGHVGVMNGSSSDLRPGLTWQMVEIHEPVRLLVVVEATAERLQQVLGSCPQVAQLIENRWVQTVLSDPETGGLTLHARGALATFEPDDRELPAVETSVDWFRGKRHHLRPARIERALRTPEAPRP